MSRRKPRTLAEAVGPSAASEAAFQASVTDYATMTGWWWWHDQDSRRNREGFPDLLLMRGTRQVVAELKREGEKPTPAQVDVLGRFARCGAEVYLWRPSDWPDVEAVLRRGAIAPEGLQSRIPP